MNRLLFALIILFSFIVTCDAFFFSKDKDPKPIDDVRQKSNCSFMNKKCLNVASGLFKCTRAACKVIPIKVILEPSKIKEIDLGKNQIRKVPKMDVFTGLEKLCLSYNSISEIEKKAFENNTKLVEVDLSYNKLTKIGSTKNFYKKISTF